MQARRAGLSLVLGGIVGLVVAGLVGSPRLVGPANLSSFLSNAFTFWGLLVGSFAAVVAAGVTFAILNRRDRKASRWGRIAGDALVVVAAGTWWWIVMWRVPPFTLEGLWMYPLGLAATVGSLLLLLRRRQRGAWDEPPRG